MACAGLIARFIDQDLAFLCVPAPHLLQMAKGTGDVPGVEMSHEGRSGHFHGNTPASEGAVADCATRQRMRRSRAA